jgi:DNA-binding MarR family transcriptional regulator
MVSVSEGRKATLSPESAELAKSVHDLIRVLLRYLQPVVETEGISKGQFWVMHVLSNCETGSVNDVAQRLSLSAPSVSVTVDQLEKAGLVTRVRSASDRRTVNLTLTAKGRMVEERVWGKIERQIADVIADLPRPDIAITVQVIGELSKRLDAIPASREDLAK